VRDVDLEEAARTLREGGLVAFPTETVYGLGARADDPAALARVFDAKGRPRTHPLIVHIASAAELADWASEIPPAARRLADVLWPGPLTLVVRRREGVLDEVTGGRDTVAVRVPRHPLALALIRAAGVAVAAPSANKFGHVSPTRAEHVRAEGFDDDLALLDGGPCEVGLESTIVDATRAVPALLRPGGIDVETIEEVLGAPIADGRGGEARAPGMLASHYAPRARVIPVRDPAEAADRARELPGKVAFVGSVEIPGATFVPVGDLESMARTLYATLRALDLEGHDVILVELPDEKRIGLAIADRVRRASARE
jgi:L-threonylcarbamoyladenylate synthase